jgi:NADH dehydrogenase
VELAAELREASNAYADYGFRRLDPSRDVRITLLEGAPRILAPLPERVSSAAARLLAKRNVTVVTDCRVTEIRADSVSDADGVTRPADLCVWAAGIKAPEFLTTLGLPTNKAGQIEVTGHLNVKGYDDIYAFGDCAACPGAEGRTIPPRAQAAHQQADYLLEVLTRKAAGKPAQNEPFVYRDYGSLVSIGQQTTVGSLMGSLKGLNWFVEGFYARIMYMSLHLMHHKAILGALRTAVLAVGRTLVKRTTALVKLH